MKQVPTGGLVYSTEAGRMCLACRRPVAACGCKQALVPATGGPVRVSRESKGRGGKTVTVVKGLPLDAMALATQAVARRLRIRWYGQGRRDRSAG